MSASTTTRFDRRKCLLQLAEELADDQFQKLKFLLGDCVPHGKLESMTSALQLFGALEQSLQLTPDLLKESFETIQRVDLSEKVVENWHLLAIRVESTPSQSKRYNGQDLVCDGPEQTSKSKDRKAGGKETGLLTSIKSNTSPGDDKNGQPEKMAADGHRPTGLMGVANATPMNVQGDAPTPTPGQGTPCHILGTSLSPDVVTDAGEGSEDTAGVASNHGASAINDGNGSSIAAAAATASNPSDYKKSGARPKDSNPIAKTDGKAGPSEQTDHGGVTNQCGDLYPDDSSHSNTVPPAAQEEQPKGACADVAHSGKSPAEGAMDFGQHSALHGSMHPHTEFSKKTQHTYSETHTVSGYQGLPGYHPTLPQSDGPASDVPGAWLLQLQPQPQQQQQELRLYRKHGYGIRIPQGQHYDSQGGDEGLVLMKNGETFWMEIQNTTDCDCEVDITFGGRYLGCWLLENGPDNKIKVEGSAWEGGALTFFSSAEQFPQDNQADSFRSGIIECTFAPEAITLVVETLKSSMKSDVTIPRKAKVEDLVNKIAQICHLQGISCLVYGKRPLSRGNTLSAYKMESGDTVRVLTSEERLVIKHQEQLIAMTVNPHKSLVKDVLGFLEKELHCPSERLCVKHKEKILPLGEKLEAVFLDGEAVLEAEVAETFDVTIREPGGNEQLLTTHTFATVAQLRRKAQDGGMMSSSGGQLVFSGSNLNDDKKSLGEYNIGPGSVIDVQPSSGGSSSRSFGSTTRSFGFPSGGTRSFGLSLGGTRSFGSSSGLRLFDGSAGAGTEAQVACLSGTRGIGDFPGDPIDGYVGLIGNQVIHTNLDEVSRKFEKKLAVTLRLRLVSSSSRPVGRPPAPVNHPRRTPVPPPVPE